jgi:cellulose synthase/poly-beta-1,6-N-acetylglucosamine synthase-like glycosyltransferase
MAELLFAAAAFFVYLFVHPYTVYPLTLAVLPKRPLNTGPLTRRPTVAICMSAYNEEAVIIAKVEQLLAMQAAYGPASVHIYVDGGHDSTAALLAPYADRVRVVATSERRGKTAGLNALVAGCESDLIAFTDANVQVPAGSLELLVRALEDPHVSAASARLVYTNPSSTGVSATGAAYWNLEEMVKALESQTVGLLGVDGAMFVIKRDDYQAPPDDLIDDLYVSLAAMLTGKRVVSAQAVRVEERNAERWQEEFWRKARIACQALRVHQALWPRISRSSPLLIYAYLSHRVLKWMMPFSLGCAAALGLTGIGVVYGWAAPVVLTTVAVVALGLGAWLNLPFSRIIVTALISLCGVAWGQIEALVLKRTYVTWTPASTVRR